jgi:ribonucleoside-diphosphate reductase alpha chain
MHATRLWTLTLEISVMMAQFPSKEIAQLSYDFRTLGLGYANIGGLLMNMGYGYDSPEGRAMCGALTAIMTGVAYATSAEIASELGPSRASSATASTCCASCATTAPPPMARPTATRRSTCPWRSTTPTAPTAAGGAGQAAWDEALTLGEATATATRRPP